MQDHTLVSIIVPCYNVDKYVQRCIESILSQSMGNLECIAVDDCSSDSTRTVLDSFEDPRLQVLHLQNNGGVSNARNIGISAAKGEWLMFVDGDDFLPVDAVAILLDMAEADPDIVLAAANARHYSEDGLVPGRIHFKKKGKIIFSPGESPEKFLEYQEHFNNCCFKLFKRSGMGRFAADLKYGEDTLLCHRYVLEKQGKVYLDYGAEVYCYRQIPSSCIHSASVARRLHDLEHIVTELDEVVSEMKFPVPVTDKKAAEYMWVMKKYSTGRENAASLLATARKSNFYSRHLVPALKRGKFKHRILLWLIEHGMEWTFRFW